MKRIRNKELGIRNWRLMLLATLLYSLFFILYSTPALAQTGYQPLEPLPGITPDTEGKISASAYITGIFMLTIAVASILAVVMIIVGGIQYMSTDAIGGKSEAKGTIEHAIWGLLLAMSAWLILNTINPELTRFDLKIPIQELEPSSPGTGGGPSGGRSARCLGEDCIHSYKNASGNIVNYKDCSSCVLATNLDLKIKNRVVNGTNAQINTALGTRLQGTKGTPGTPDFQVTETWPPTVNHLSQEQYDGTSVDVKLLKPTANNINTFINNAEKNGLRVVYEVSNSTQKKTYVDAGVPETKIIVAKITGEHFSVYKK